MANDASLTPAAARAPRSNGDAQARVVRHFRQIVLWPIQLITGKPKGKRESADALFERLGGGNWELVDDEFGVEGDAFQERHYREFVSFLPHVQRFLYGDAPGSLRSRWSRISGCRSFRRWRPSAGTFSGVSMCASP